MSDDYAGELSSMLGWLFTLPAIHGQGGSARVEVLGFGFHGDVGHLVKLGVGAEVCVVRDPNFFSWLQRIFSLPLTVNGAIVKSRVKNANSLVTN